MKENNNKIPVFEEEMEFGIYSLGDHLPNPHTGELISAKERLEQITQMAVLAEEVGLDVFVLGESHQDGFVSQAHTIILSNIIAQTKNIKLSSGVSVLSTTDPVRLFEDFATMDLLSGGRMELVAGRASRVGLFELLGYDLQDYEGLYEEKLDLLQKINQNEYISWQGNYRAPLNDAHVLPRPMDMLPLWRAVGGTRSSAIRAGRAGLPMYLAHLGGTAKQFSYTIDAYREAAQQVGYDPETLPVATAGFFYTAPTTLEALQEYYPHINQGMMQSNGRGFAKELFAQARDTKSIINVGTPEEIIEKILYQHKVFKNQRYIAQLDFGGVPFDKIKHNIEVFGKVIVPEVRRRLREENENSNSI